MTKDEMTASETEIASLKEDLDYWKSVVVSLKDRLKDDNKEFDKELLICELQKERTAIKKELDRQKRWFTELQKIMDETDIPVSGDAPFQIIDRVRCSVLHSRRELASLKEEIARLKGETYCAYCGERFLLDAPDATELVTNHIKECPRHPMRAVEFELAAAQRVIAGMGERERHLTKILNRVHAAMSEVTAHVNVHTSHIEGGRG